MLSNEPSELQGAGSPPHPYRRKAPQPLSAVEVPDALLTVATVSALTGVSASTLYRLAKSGELVPVKRGLRCTRWRAGDVTAFLRAQSTAQ